MARHLGQLTREKNRLMTLAAAPGGLESADYTSYTPTIPPEFDAKDYVSFLLYIDAEIEHGLMVQYLYAAYSLGGPQVPETHREMIRGWQEIIFGVAKEEMGHLISVQNVLRLIGAPLNFARDDFPWDTPFYPFPFSLEPLSLESLACYVFAESPKDWSGKEADEVKKLAKMATETPHQVSALFSELIGCVECPEILPDEAFQAETWPYQAKSDEWGRGYQGGLRGDASGANPPHTPDVLVLTAASRDDAVDALKQIAEQGEANPGEDQAHPSHFARFLKIFREMKKLLPTCKREGWSPARAMASNPYIPPSDGEDPSAGLTVKKKARDPITNPEAQAWAHLFNVRYRMLLSYLIHSYEVSGGPADGGPKAPRATVINATFGEMYNLRAIATILVQTPLSTDAGGKSAGPPFEMPYTLNRPMGEANRWRLHRDLLLASGPLVDSLLAASPASRHRYLHSLREADAGLLGLIDRIIEGYGDSVI